MIQLVPIPVLPHLIATDKMSRKIERVAFTTNQTVNNNGGVACTRHWKGG